MIVTPRWATPFLAVGGAGLLGIAFQRDGGPFANETSFLFIVLGALTASSHGLQRAFVSRIPAWTWLAAAAAFLLASRYVIDAAMIVLAPLLLMVLVFGAANFPALAALLKSRPFQFVGGCSYSLYLWQELFLGSSWLYFRPAPPLWALPVVVWLSWRFIEKPGMALGRAWTRRVTSPPNAETGFT
jgi:peptidoglycan/LPS O-acetylase OafA/YrhL